MLLEIKNEIIYNRDNCLQILKCHIKCRMINNKKGGYLVIFHIGWPQIELICAKD
jgi:hypothetical protein